MLSLAFKSPGAFLAISIASCLAIACSAGPAPTQEGAKTGQVVLALTATGDLTLSSVDYTISGGPTAKTGMIDISNSNNIRAVIGGLTAGTGYLIALSATSSTSDVCAGSAGPVTVHENATTSVTVVLTCHRRGDTGSIAVNGTIDVCPGIVSVAASPAEVIVGNDITIVASAGPDESAIGFPLAYNWTGATSSSAGTATFHCSVAGTFPVSLSVTNGDTSCSGTDPGASATVTVSCTGDARNGGDTTPPTLTGFTVSPASINTMTRPATITATFSATDDLSGVNFANVFLRSPSGAQERSCGGSLQTSAVFKTVSCDLLFPAFSEGGAWTVSRVSLGDVAGNIRALVTADLQTAGFSITVTVVST